MRDIVIFGCGGHGRELLQTIIDQNLEQERWRVRGFLVSPRFSVSEAIHGFPVFSTFEDLGTLDNLCVAVGIGSGHERVRVVNELRSAGLRSFPPIVHPRASVGRTVSLGEGVVVCAGAIITTDVVLGDHCHVNVGATISHDTMVGSFSTIGPGVNIAGGVRIGQGVEIGTSACIIPRLSVGDWSIIGAGAVVVRNIPGESTAFGVPAKVVGPAKY